MQKEINVNHSAASKAALNSMPPVQPLNPAAFAAIFDDASNNDQKQSGFVEVGKLTYRIELENTQSEKGNRQTGESIEEKKDREKKEGAPEWAASPLAIQVFTLSPTGNETISTQSIQSMVTLIQTLVTRVQSQRSESIYHFKVQLNVPFDITIRSTKESMEITLFTQGKLKQELKEQLHILNQLLQTKLPEEKIVVNMGDNLPTYLSQHSNSDQGQKKRQQEEETNDTEEETDDNA